MPDLSYTVVDPPAVQPPRVSLLASAEEVTDGARWTAGLTFEPFGCGYNGGVFPACVSEDAEYDDKDFESEHRVVEVEPYVAWYGDSCSAATFRSRNFADRASRMFLAAESAIMARELWAGDIASSEGHPTPFLGDGNATTVAVGYGPSMSLVMLQQALAEAVPSRGMIHAARDLASLWYESGLVRREGALLLDAFDNIVVADAGYPGTGPEGEGRTLTTSYAYATDLVQVRRDGQVRLLPGDGDFAAAMNRDTNLIEWRAERMVAAYWSGCAQLVVGVDHCAVECPSEGEG